MQLSQIFLLVPESHFVSPVPHFSQPQVPPGKCGPSLHGVEICFRGRPKLDRQFLFLCLVGKTPSVLGSYYTITRTSRFSGFRGDWKVNKTPSNLESKCRITRAR